jgi:hypothetical protein
LLSDLRDATTARATASRVREIAAIDGARRLGETQGVEMLSLSDAEYLDIDEVILVKQVSAPVEGRFEPDRHDQIQNALIGPQSVS